MQIHKKIKENVCFSIIMAYNIYVSKSRRKIMKLNEIRIILDEPIAELVWNNGESKLVCPTVGVKALIAKVNGTLDDILDEFGDIEVIHAGIVGNAFSIELDSSGDKANDAMARVVKNGLMAEGFDYVEEAE